MKKHSIHKYSQSTFKKSRTTIFRCTIEGCNHFVYEPLIIGRYCECYRCGETFVITRKSLTAKRLHCDDCTRGQFNKLKEKTVTEQENASIVDDILTDINDVIEMQQQEKENQNQNQNQNEGSD